MAVSEFTVQRAWQANRASPARWVLSHVGRHWIFLVGILIGALGNAGGAQLVPLFIGQAFDAISHPQPDYGVLATAAILIVASQIVRAILQLGRNFSAEIIGQRLERDLRDELYASLIGKSMSFHDRQKAGDIMARCTNDVREINLMMNPGVNLVIGSGAFLFFPAIFAWSIHPQLVLIPLAYIALYVLAVWRYLAQLLPASRAVRHNFGLMNSALAESIEGIETVKGAAQETREIGRFDQALRRWRDAFVRQGDVESLYWPQLLLGVTMAFGLLHTLVLFNAGQISVGNVIAYNGMLMMFGFPTFTAQFSFAQVASGMAGARRMLDLINAESKLDENVGGYDAPMRGEVTFDHVCFDYNESLNPCDDQSAAALRDVSFHVLPGQTVAIVGQTGSGKSSIIKLINRIYDVNSGCVKVDGVDVRDWNLAALRRQISIIEQDVFLFSRTISENIAFGVPGATQEQIEAAAKAAQAHEFIMAFQDGYQTVVGERGVTLSGGQRQRIALARAFLTNPRILVLDDSTSAIDSATEDMIQRAIFRAAEGRTTFIITHRLSQIRWADMIIVMKKGRAVAVGRHEELMRLSPAYRAIFDF
ncbi:MAG: ABC transporter ATP-binding protein [Anaerolineae bacterium]|nr:ABC transporter ATP-binding protein/permease [Thermoflexales bacterium]MDW8407930.1 ABC transporter ATP-binding protein [Anaerolineae bacterium]